MQSVKEPVITRAQEYKRQILFQKTRFAAFCKGFSAFFCGYAARVSSLAAPNTMRYCAKAYVMTMA